ncbi:TPA: non-ribosomal peptide synthase/polyketide synthase [Pseudomonas aeruginosa]|uniref:non-ribosomal peptide synthase/polyketide synthase n=2 Tax=Pseudomonas aeruginosa TaxID=287 RepID=UPI0010680E21|nr:non-ribosomal peptide synthase/polyketide synthase [Pseudomonas aeruginosa]TEF43073.1 amino acid adenylation domain-containing protein [Pseudomonas aeruginosa]HCE6534261.1 non-ribosomal peptide synthase/polyketide synthase [Pseudomonas aeruginosa]HCE9361457.1 non-ribosomal peptide synthase/polyketide synthase [Pseudomonas aeruginosa]HCE9387062.1 non-ribosomal peptide synthase/polyketide synthase [Pseudomonas aeruginosa]HCR1349798.1 non-ribosomal peptide synthase/polyketide synthase [Pseudom
MDMSVALRVARRFITLPLDKRKLYLAKMQEEGVTPANLPIPEVASAFERIPLSYAQERQWFLWQMDPQSAAYNIPSALRLRGELDVEALSASLGAIVERHQSLRTVFVEDEQLDGFRQQVLASVDVPVPVTLAGDDDAQAQIRAFVESETQQPFDLRNGPLLRARLLRLAADDHVLTLTIHHVAADGWSMRVLVEELIALYGARRQGVEATLPDLPIQYADYAIWQRHWLEAGERERQLEYWMARLGGGQSVLELPTDRQRPALPSYRGARHELQLPQALGRQLQALAQREGTTLFMLLLASFQALLHRYSGQDEIRVGVPVANRNRVETERLIGFFVNTQVLRADLDTQMPFLDLLQQTRVAALGAQSHQDLPFEQLVEALQPERSLSHSPLFQAMYNHQNLGSAGRQSLAAQLPGLSVEDLSWGAHSAQFDLTLDTYESEQGVHAEFTYATDLFEAATVERLARHWRNLLEAVVAEPRRRLGDLPLLDAEERATLLQRSRLPASEYPAGQGVHRLFEAQAGLTPDAPALLFGEERLSYAELNALANRLAWRLREEGVGSDVLVGIALERGVPMVVALLAVLKAGGAYVPLDPQYPADRLQYMIDDSGLRLLLSQQSVLARLPQSDGLQSLLLDDLERLVHGYPAENPDLPEAPDSLCYAIYTSGSTGQPKGVMVRHRALTNFVCSIARQPGMLARDRLLSVTTFSFDIFGLELYVPLARGASMLLASREQAQDPEALLDLVERQGVTVLQATPATWRMLCDSERVDLLRGCTLLCGGEALAEDLAARMRGLSASTWNLYGPTETTIWSARFCLGEEARPFLGGPLENTALYILDSEMNPCPPGVAGELLIGGDGLARGYHRRPGLTAERFLPDPFAADGSRLYRTGDLARYRADGVIEYLGRIDHQVKIRGFRIELGEIETRLLEQDSVREAVVVAQPGVAGPSLVAYLVPTEAALVDAESARQQELRSALKNSLLAVLPDYMVPAHMLLLENLPLTPNGKINRKALPLPDASAVRDAHVAPEGELERAMAAIWSEVLKLGHIGRDDNFFELGGHSLLVTQVVSRVRRRLDLQVPLRTLFEHSTLRAYAQAVAQLAPAAQGGIVRCARDSSPQLSFAQERQWFIWRLDPHSAAYNIPVALRLKGPLRRDALQGALDLLVQRHETLRTTFVEHDGAPRQVIHPTLPIAIEERRPPVAGEDLKGLVETEAHRPFDLQRGPLLRVLLLPLATDECVLVLTLHHIIADGWSMQVLVDELIRVYAALRHDEPPALAELPIQYADFAAWQRQWMDGGERERQLGYWVSRLGGEQPLLELPSDRPRPQQQSHRGRRIGIPLPAELAEALRRLAQAEQGTLFMLLLASFQALLHRYSGQNDIRVGVPIANRNREETEGLIGFFVNTQVLCAELDGQLPFRELLRQVRRAVVEAQGHQDLPFEQLVDALQPERSLSHAPLFQVMYNHQRDDHRGSRFASLGELEVEDLAWDVQTAQFDLTLDTYESSNGLLAELTYATDLFDASSAERIAGHWLNLLRSIVARPEARIAELKLLDEAEARADLLQWNPHPQDFPPASCLHRLIERQAAERPRATAVVYGERALDYGELNLRANRLAHRLIELGVGPDVLVGLAAERSLEMIVGLLAILKAGGAYVPLDPRYPSDRLGYMIEDSGIRLLLTQRAARERLPLGEGLPCLLLDAEHEWAGYPESDPQSAVGVDNLAYVIYTSGSTGKPKGTLLPHGNVLRLFDATRHWFGFSADDAWSLFHSYAFDFSVWEIFGALLHGGRLVIVPYETSRSPEDFLRLLCRERVTVLNQTPSAFKQLMQVACAGQEVPPLALRHVVFGGEALEVQALRPWFERFGDRAPRLVNMYGITETTVHVTYRPLSLADLDGGAASPIGEPIPDLSWYLLDAGLNPVPRGCIGELYVGGAGLARGYLNRPELSCTRFVADPFSTTGGRLYRTGDLARYRCDGVVEYVGRIDHQVKIRGFRIELGEIEARLLAQPGVAEAVVLPHEGPGATQLVGYVVTQAAPSDPAALRDTLRQALKASLPEHMVPAHLLFLERLPLTANGKLDRRALPAPDASRLQRDYTAPRSELEQRLAAIWADVLKLGRVGLDDNFFELGGDSIISIQVVSRARQAGIRLAPRDLFLHQTIRGLAGVAVEGRGLACAEQGPISGSTPLLPIQQMFFELDIPRRQHWNQSVLLEPGQALDGTLLETALQALLAHHDALRLGFRLEDGTWRAEHRRAVEAGEVLLWQQSVADGQALEALAEQVQRSLDLGSGPLLRALLATLGDGSQRLLLVIHHLVVDGVSWRILLEDLQTAYRQLQAGQAVALPAKTSAFKAWAERLQAHARDGGLEGERGYWLAQLEGVSTELPCDDREGAQSVRHVRSARTELTEEATRRLLQEAPAAYRTQVNDLLLTALARVIGRWTGQADTLIQLEGHGREELFEDIDLTRTVGWFTSLFPLRLSPVAELGASIKRIKEQLRAIPHKGLGFGALRYLGSAEDRAALAALPSPRITFNYLGQFDGSFSADSSALFRPSADAAGSERDSDAPLDNWLSLNGQVYAGRLGIDWSFSAARFSEASILRLADAYRDELLALIEHCCAADVEGVTPSDFPLAGLDQRQLDALPLAAGEVEDLYPLSPMQQGMLFHSLYQQNSGDYINQMRLDVEGLDPQRFREAWQAALDAHEVLRSGFLWQGALEKPLQLVRKRVEVPFSVHDWRDRADLAEALDALAAGEAGLGFELAEAPLLRLVLVRTGERRHHLIYTNHHILMDGWSNSQLLGEVLQRYRGETPSRSDGRYRDYIAWLQRQDAGRTEAFWKQRLQRLGEPTLLVPAFAHGVRGAEGHADRYRQLDVTTSQRLAEFAREQKVTLNTLVQAAWLILLQRFTGQDTVAFGATVSGRPAELRGIEEQIGLFINTLPVVASPCPEQPIGDWLQAVQGENLALREFEHTPLYDIQRWAGQVGEALFDNILVFENYPVSAALAEETPADMRIDALSNQEQTHYPLTLLVSAGETLELHYSYSRQAFDEAAIECLAERLERLLLGMCENPGASLGELDSLAVAERYQLLEGWNATAAEYPLQRGVHRLFEEQVERTPTAPALAFGEERLDYAELNRRANRLAHALIERGIGADRLVGVAMERSIEMVVALMAILKAGGAYVPVDPEYPEERQAYMLEDSGVQLLLSQSHLKLPLAQGVQRIDLDQADAWLENHAENNPGVELNGENLAYVIYTSGSTGKPKGAGNRHSALSNRLCWMQQAYGLGVGDTVLQKTPFSFDVSVWEFFWPLMSGARLVVAAPGDHRAPAKLVALINREGVDTLHFVPSMLQAFLQDEDVASCTSLKRIVCSGEALPADAQQQVFAKLPQAGLYNLYGPTEAAIDVTHWTCVEEGKDAVPIGRPIANLACYILDGNLEPVPVGVLGELYLAGRGLARGYHQRPGLTAERFVASPFVAGERMYRTGDLARYRADGVIEYAGRIDHQVKLRGLRIELGEIEARLLEHPWVREAAVLAVDGRQLVGYVVLESEGGDWREALAAHLAASLPEYMVPAQWLALERMPLSPNGKLDRKALPKIEAEDGLGEYVAPASEPERQLAAIWADVLGRERVGVTDNFFALGGDSIVSIQVVSRARQAGLQLSPRDLFQLQNIRKLAERCSAAAPVAEPASVPDGAVLHNLLPQQVQALPLPHERLEHLYSLSPMQQGMLFLGLNSPDAELYINQLSIAVDGLDPQRLQRAWSAVAQRHEVLRSGFLWLDQEEPLQFVLADPGLPFEVLDWRGRAISDEALEQVAQQERRKGFDLGQPPLQRIRLLRLGEDRYQLIWTYHHILIDGWSTSQLFGEILELYSGGSLPPAVPYRHYIAWLRARDGKASEAFWRRQLARMDEPTYLADAFNAAREGYGHQALYTRLDSDATEHLKRFAQSQRVTLNTLVQGAWLLLLSRYSGQRCVSFGATVAGRPASLEASERILGLFINTLPVVCEVAPEQCVGDWLRALQDYNLEMREQEYTPLSDIQRWAGRSGQSLFDSIIVFENHPVDRTLRDWRDDSLRFGEMRSAGLTNFPMDLMVTSDDSGLAIEYMFLREHFAVASVERLRTDMEGLLAALSGDAECRLGNIGLPSARVPLADGACPDRYPLVHQRIGEWSRRTPDATALVFDERSHSFAELDARANRLAHALVERGVAADVRVGVALPRGTELVVALLAVLKAGGAYVPLDLAYPRERLAYLMQDSGIALLLSESQALVQLPVPAGVPALALDRLDLLEHPAQAPQVEVHPANLAYVIYTSGSTGLPKGVAVSHGPLAMHIDAVGERYEMSPADRELHFMSFAFDGAHERWLTALGHGGSLLLRDDALWTPEQTYAAMQRHGVTVAAFPPVYLQQLAEHAERDGNPPPVRIYCFGGDAVPVAGFELAKRALKPRYIINGYGPTETVVTPLIWKAAMDTECGAAYAPIGSFVGERCGYVLDADLNPLPAGVAGELYLGGVGLARGYLQRPGLSAERFVANPFSRAGERLYRTGDLVRQREDGTFDYLGRIDNQVKVRGFRIELGEIEARLQDAGEVREAVVVARDAASGKQLLGYVVAEDGADASGLLERLRERLKRDLPEYMVPAHLALLPAMPLTPNGKIDRKALPDIDVTASEAYVAPRNELELALAGIWQEVLGIARIGVHDNFFELGGDSILSMQVVAKARALKKLGFSLKLRDLIQKPSIAALSGYDDSAAPPSPILALNAAVDGCPPLFCVHAGFGTVFDYEPLARRLNGRRSVLAIQARSLLDPNWRDASLQRMAEDYVALIRQRQAEGPYHLLGWSLGGTLGMLMAAELERQGQQVAFLGLLDSYVPGTEAPAADDWREDLLDFLSVSAGLETRPPLAAGLEQRDNVSAAIAECLGVGQTGKGGLGCDELAQVFLVARQLKQLSGQLDSCSPIQVRPLCWWTRGRGEEVRALSRQLGGQPLAGRVAACGHFQIPHAQEVLDSLVEALEEIHGSLVYS